MDTWPRMLSDFFLGILLNVLDVFLDDFFWLI